MSGNEPIEIRRCGPINSIAGLLIAAAGVTGLYLIASGKFGLFPDFWRWTFGAVMLGLFGRVALSVCQSGRPTVRTADRPAITCEPQASIDNS